MKKTISKSEFRDAFKEMDREDKFSRAGIDALFDYIEGLDEDSGHETEIDVIAFCCEFSEYKNREEAAEEYNIEPAELDNHTTVIEFDGGVIIQNF
jgi:hypothetical protein